MSYSMPLGACDTHVHVFDSAHFPYQEPRSYTPGDARHEDLVNFQRSCDFSRTVLVQPSVYGMDNSCLLSSLHKLGQGARAVAVVDPFKVTDKALQDLADKGVRGLRVNFGAATGEPVRNPVEVIEATASRVSGTDLFIQIYYSSAHILEIARDLNKLRVPLVLDHFAGINASNSDADIQNLLSLVTDAGFWVKFSASYRVKRDGYDDHVLESFAGSLLERHSDCLIWGSDWPHTGGGADRIKRSPSEIEPFQKIDSRAALDMFRSWCGDEELFKKILHDNPERLFQF